MSVYNWFAFASLLVSTVLVLRRMGRLRGTTLVAPTRWLLLALFVLGCTLGVVELGTTSDATRAAMRYFAATCTLCPLMAVLGAKRPQDKGWQFIVGSLWLILVLPVGEMFLLWRGGAMDVGPMRSWFLVILLGVGLTNYALTRFAGPVFMATVGIGCMLAPHLPLLEGWGASNSIFGLGILFVCAGLLLVCWQVNRAPTKGNWNSVWIEFRNAFGLVWGLRVMERINETARLGDWGTELTWFGFDAERLEELKGNDVEKGMRTTLRRFVSADWIDRRRRDIT